MNFSLCGKHFFWLVFAASSGGAADALSSCMHTQNLTQPLIMLVISRELCTHLSLRVLLEVEGLKVVNWRKTIGEEDCLTP